jgi:hypothetical protein
LIVAPVFYAPILSKYFAFFEGENRLKSIAPTFGRKYGVYEQSKMGLFGEKSEKA